jgi:hypothetical protein
VRLRTGKAYVWVLATAQEVVYILRPSREVDFLAELLKDVRGVLVSDFYAAYDAIGCFQQKCLIHLMRDMNQELLNNPFDTELQSITGPFGTLMRAIVMDIDEHGLKRCHLVRHMRTSTRTLRGWRVTCSSLIRRKLCGDVCSRIAKNSSPSSSTMASVGTTIWPRTAFDNSPITARITQGGCGSPG